MSTLTSTIEDMLTPSLLGSLAARSGLPDTKIKTGMNGAIASVLDGLVGKANDPRAMTQVADLIAKTPDGIDAEKLLNENAPIRKSGSQLLDTITPDSSSLVSRIAKFAGVGGAAASGLLGAAASIAMSAFHKLGRERGGLDASSLASSLLSEREAIHAAVPAALSPPSTEARHAVEHGALEPVARKSRSWWVIALIGLVLLGTWMVSRSRTKRAEVRPASVPSQTMPRRENVAPAPPAGQVAPRAPESATAEPALSFPPGTAQAGFLAHVTNPSGSDDTSWLDLDAVRFDPGSAEIRSSSGAQLADIAKILAANPSIHIEVSGYADAAGSQDARQKLSAARAQNVRQALIAEGVEGARIKVEGNGEQRKAEPTTGAAQPSQRVAIRITSR